MNRHSFQLSLLFLLCLPWGLEAYQTKEVRGMAVSGNADTITYSLRSQKPSPSIPAGLNPIIEGDRMTLNYQFYSMSCSIGDDAVILRGDSIIIQKTISGHCIKNSRAYSFHAEIAGIPSRDFILVFWLINAYGDPCKPSIKTLASMKVSPGSSKDSTHNIAPSGSGRLAFQSIRSKETFKSGNLRVSKNTGSRYQVQRLEDSLPVGFTRDTMGIRMDNGEIAFESRYRKRQCGEYGIGIRASADTIFFIHKDGGDCSGPAVSHGLKGRISNLAKGRYWLKIMTENGYSGICANDAKTLLTREFIVPK